MFRCLFLYLHSFCLHPLFISIHHRGSSISSKAQTFLSPVTTFQLSRGDNKVFPGQPRNIISVFNCVSDLRPKDPLPQTVCPLWNTWWWDWEAAQSIFSTAPLYPQSRSAPQAHCIHCKQGAASLSRVVYRNFSRADKSCSVVSLISSHFRVFASATTKRHVVWLNGNCQLPLESQKPVKPCRSPSSVWQYSSPLVSTRQFLGLPLRWAQQSSDHSHLNYVGMEHCPFEF